MNCLNCNKILQKNNKFCSNSCQKEYQYQSYIKKWKSRSVSGLRVKYQTYMYIKTYMLKKYNYRCCKC